jgi:hypothetical protein
MSTTADRIFVSWTQQWDIEQYLEHYMRTRRIKPEARDMVRSHVDSYPGKPPFTKSDLDFYLDANFRRHG